MKSSIKPLFKTSCKLAVFLLLTSCIPNQKAKLPIEEPDVTGPLPAIGETISKWIEEPETKKTVGREIKVAILLPLSGKSADIGKQMLDAAMLGVVDAKVSNDQIASIVLIPKDSGTSATLAKTLASEAIAQGASAFIGPLFSQSVNEVSSITTQKNIPVVALTNNLQVAKTGVNVFGFAPEDQVRRVVDYAINNGASHFAMLSSNDSYGTVASEALKKAVTSKGAVVTTVELYGKHPKNLEAAAKRLSESHRLQPFNSLLIADTPVKTDMLIKALKENGVDTHSIKLLGTALWEDAGPILSNSLNGGIFATTDMASNKSFSRRFKAVYGYEPKKIASLAYDAVRLLAAKDVNLQGETLGAATGAYKINTNGITERSLAILQITPNGLKTLSPAVKRISPQ